MKCHLERQKEKKQVSMQQSKEVMYRNSRMGAVMGCAQTYSNSALGLLGRFFSAWADNTDWALFTWHNHHRRTALVTGIKLTPWQYLALGCGRKHRHCNTDSTHVSPKSSKRVFVIEHPLPWLRLCCVSSVCARPAHEKSTCLLGIFNVVSQMWRQLIFNTSLGRNI